MARVIPPIIGGAVAALSAVLPIRARSLLLVAVNAKNGGVSVNLSYWQTWPLALPMMKHFIGGESPGKVSTGDASSMLSLLLRSMLRYSVAVILP